MISEAIPNKTKVTEILLNNRINDDKRILDFLSKPENEFKYSITAQGMCKVSHPKSFLAINLRHAVLKIIN